MASMDKKAVAEILDEMGTLFEIKGENPFKCRAFHNGARVVESLTQDITELVESDGLKEVKGIGQGLADTIKELVTTGTSKNYNSLRSSLPPGLLDMVKIQGLGPKKIKILFEKLKVTSIPELKEACEKHRLAQLDGFGDKTEENILKGIELRTRVSDKHLYSTAKESADEMLKAISKLKEVKRCDVAGSLRRRKEIIGDIDIVVSADQKNRQKIFRAFVTHPFVESIIGQGDTKASVALKSGINCDMRIVDDSEYPFALNYFTGSKEHNVEMRSRARKVGWSLNEYEFSKIQGEKNVKRPASCKEEQDIYEALGLTYVPPELRENSGEFEAAEKGKIPKLIEEKDLKGTFHCHTTASDGSNSLEEMVEAAKQLGWQYLGIADHSKVAVYANGLSPERVKAQHKEIDKLNSSTRTFRVFKGTEVDILADGTLDFTDKVLSSFDYVVASIHSKFKMTEAEATKRIIRALKNKYVTMLGHPTGRLLLSRDGYPLNLNDVINAASDYGKSIEINAHPMRLDLDWRLVKYAKQKGIKICINPDAHNTDGLNDVRFGIGIARKGWLESKNVVNCWPVKEVEQFFLSTRS
jgi:DNA polymerase (family 10)